MTDESTEQDDPTTDPELRASSADKDRKDYEDILSAFRSGQSILRDKRTVEELRRRIPKKSKGYDHLDVLVQAAASESETVNELQTASNVDVGNQDEAFTLALARAAATSIRLGRAGVPRPADEANCRRWLFGSDAVEAPDSMQVEALLVILRKNFAKRWREALTHRIKAGLKATSDKGGRGQLWDVIREQLRKLNAQAAKEQAALPPETRIDCDTAEILALVDRLVVRSQAVGLALATARKEPLGEQAKAFVRETLRIVEGARESSDVGLATPEIWLQLDAYAAQLHVTPPIAVLLEQLSRVNAYDDKSKWNIAVASLRNQLLAEAAGARSLPRALDGLQTLPSHDWFADDEHVRSGEGYRAQFTKALGEIAAKVATYAQHADAAAALLVSLRVTDPSTLPAWQDWSRTCQTALEAISKTLNLPAANADVLQVTRDAIGRAAATKQLPEALHDLSRHTLDGALEELGKTRPGLNDQLRPVFQALQPSQSLGHAADAVRRLQLDNIPIAAYFATAFTEIPVQLGAHLLTAVERRHSAPELPTGLFRLFGDNSLGWSRLWEVYRQLFDLAAIVMPTDDSSGAQSHPLAPLPAGRSLAAVLLAVRAVVVSDMSSVWPAELATRGRLIVAALESWRETMCARLEVRLACDLAIRPASAESRSKPWRARDNWDVVDSRWATLVSLVDEWLERLPELLARDRRMSRGLRDYALLGIRATLHVPPCVDGSEDLVKVCVRILGQLFDALGDLCPEADVQRSRQSLQLFLRFQGGWLIAVGLPGGVDPSTREHGEGVLRAVLGETPSVEFAALPPVAGSLLASLEDLRWLAVSSIDRVSPAAFARVQAAVVQTDGLQRALAAVAAVEAEASDPSKRAQPLYELARAELDVAIDNTNETRGLVRTYATLARRLLESNRATRRHHDPELHEALRGRFAELVRTHQGNVGELVTWTEAADRLIEDPGLTELRQHLKRFAA